MAEKGIWIHEETLSIVFCNIQKINILSLNVNGSTLNLPHTTTNFIFLMTLNLIAQYKAS